MQWLAVRVVLVVRVHRLIPARLAQRRIPAIGVIRIKPVMPRDRIMVVPLEVPAKTMITNPRRTTPVLLTLHVANVPSLLIYVIGVSMIINAMRLVAVLGAS